MCHADNKFMKDYDQNIESSYHKYWDVNKLVNQKLMQNYDDDRDKENIFEMDVSYPKHLQKMHSDL